MPELGTPPEDLRRGCLFLIISAGVILALAGYLFFGWLVSLPYR